MAHVLLCMMIILCVSGELNIRNCLSRAQPLAKDQSPGLFSAQTGPMTGFGQGAHLTYMIILGLSKWMLSPWKSFFFFQKFNTINTYRELHRPSTDHCSNTRSHMVIYMQCVKEVLFHQRISSLKYHLSAQDVLAEASTSDSDSLSQCRAVQ